MRNIRLNGPLFFFQLLRQGLSGSYWPLGTEGIRSRSLSESGADNTRRHDFIELQRTNVSLVKDACHREGSLSHQSAGKEIDMGNWLHGKTAIIIGERDGVQGPSIARCLEAAGANVVFAVTECFV